MKQFIIKTLGFSALSLLLLNGIIGLCMYLKPGYFIGTFEDYFQLEVFYRMPEKAKDKTHVIIGDSRGNADLIPSALGNQYVNLSIPGSSFYEGYISIKRRLQHCPIDTIICVYGFDYWEPTGWLIKRSVPFNYMNPDELQALMALEMKAQHLINDNADMPWYKIRQEHIKRLLKYYRIPMAFMNGFKANVEAYFDRASKQAIVAKNDSILPHLGYFQFGEKPADSTALEYNNHFTPNPIHLLYLDSLQSLCKAHKIKLLMVLPPCNQATFDRPGNQAYFKEVSQYFYERKDLEWLNTLEGYPNDCFGDPFHLNKQGAMKFTAELKSRLNYSMICISH